jgi:Photosynthetic reaction centre cytochrome C subunit
MARVSIVVAFGVFVLAGSLAVSAQAPQGRGRGAPPPLQNLQVLPKDMAFGDVIPVMQAFSAALGVTCEHCHVFNGPGDPMNDFASDAKPPKNVARAMMRMVGNLNMTVPTAVNKPADQAARVTCAMCHRGSTTPEVAPGSPGAPPPPRGGGPGGRGRGN